MRTARPLTEKTKEGYRGSAAQQFMLERLDKGAVVVNEKTGYGHAIFPHTAKSNESPSGQQVALVLVKAFRAENGEVIRMPDYIPRKGKDGKIHREGHFNQVMVEWENVYRVTQEMRRLIGQPDIQANQADVIKMDKAANVDKQAGEMAELMARFGGKL